MWDKILALILIVFEWFKDRGKRAKEKARKTYQQLVRRSKLEDAEGTTAINDTIDRVRKNSSSKK